MKILVIGGGMAGLTYAIVACKNGYEVTLVERNSRVGKKLATTGNGKCNIGNAKVDASCYNSSAIVRRVLKEISVDEYTQFLTSCGIFTYADNDGRMYPISDSASSVVDCLRHQFAKFGGRLLVDTQITSINKIGAIYQITIGLGVYEFDKVVLACGSGSQAEKPNIANILPQGVFTPLAPSLVPVKVRNMDGRLNGLRARAKVSLYDDDTLLGCESGEIQFKDYGLSGICVLNLSAIIARRQVLRKSGNYHFVVDLVPHVNEWDLEEIIHERMIDGEQDKLFYGILHNKIAEYIVKRTGVGASALDLAHMAKNLWFEFDRLLDWSMSQVTAGGIAEGYLDHSSLALSNGVVAIGEVLNVDGICGGNNLYFASASALYTFTKEQRNNAYRFR